MRSNHAGIFNVKGTTMHDTKLGRHNGDPEALRRDQAEARAAVRDFFENTMRSPASEPKKEPEMLYFGDFYGDLADYETNLREKAHDDLVKRGLLPVSEDDVNIHD